jgi:hypothetical protein
VYHRAVFFASALQLASIRSCHTASELFSTALAQELAHETAESEGNAPITIRLDFMAHLPHFGIG